MKKLVYILPSLVISGLLSTSCNNLDTKPMSDILTEQQKDELFNTDPSQIASMVSALYTALFEESASSSYFGYESLAITMECHTADFVMTTPQNALSFAECTEYRDNTATSAYSTAKWNRPYGIIYIANQLLAVLDNLDPDRENKTYNGYRVHALGVRAFEYLFLIQNFQFTYATHKSALGVPLVTTENMWTVGSQGCARASVEEVYQQIFSDLNDAITFAEETGSSRNGKGELDIYTLYGLRARANLLTLNYAAALEDSEKVINSGSYVPLSTEECMVPGFNDSNSSNWMWSVIRSDNPGKSSYTFGAYVNPFDQGWNGGAPYTIDAALFNKISLEDPRRLWWIDEDYYSAANNYTNAVPYADESSPYYNLNAVEVLSERDIPVYGVVKFAPYQNQLLQTEDISDYPLMRVEEMYLIKAEAQALGGNLASGKQTLEQFVNTYRWTGSEPYVSASLNTEDFLKNEVWFQRRIEFWGEGLSYFDLLRYRYPMDRKQPGSSWTGALGAENNISNYAFVIQPDNTVLISLLPQGEIENNRLIGDAEQNVPGQPTM